MKIGLISTLQDCLRNFVLHLSEKGDLAPLVEAPYGGLEEEISSILENRALAVSGKHFFYDQILNLTTVNIP